MNFQLSGIRKRMLMFLVGCMGARIGLAYLAKWSNGIVRKILMIATGIMATGFALIYIFGLRKTGVETQGAPIWWNHLRPIHAILYGLASWSLYKEQNVMAWKLLLGDTAFGLLAFLHYHITSGNIRFIL